jgi:hypothetical protein
MNEHLCPEGMMTPMTRNLLLAWLLLLASLPAAAQQFEQLDGYRIHYSAVNTRFLSPEVANAYDIQRSKMTALLSVSVLEEQDDGTTQPVRANIDGRAGALGGKTQPLAFRTVEKDGAISQFATFRIERDEPMRFELEVRYDRNEAPAEVAFIQRFFVD